MTYTEREIARLEGMKDGLIKKLVEECEEINDQIIALCKGTPRKKDSEIYFDRGYAKGRAEAFNKIMPIFLDILDEKFPWHEKANEIDELEKEWNKLKEQNDG